MGIIVSLLLLLWTPFQVEGKTYKGPDLYRNARGIAVGDIENSPSAKLFKADPRTHLAEKLIEENADKAYTQEFTRIKGDTANDFAACDEGNQAACDNARQLANLFHQSFLQENKNLINFISNNPLDHEGPASVGEQAINEYYTHGVQARGRDRDARAEYSLIDVASVTEQIAAKNVSEPSAKLEQPRTPSFAQALKPDRDFEEEAERNKKPANQAKGEVPRSQRKSEIGAIKSAFMPFKWGQQFAFSLLEDQTALAAIKPNRNVDFWGKDSTKFKGSDRVASKILAAQKGEAWLKKFSQKHQAKINSQVRRLGHIAGQGEASLNERHDAQVATLKKTSDVLQEIIRQTSRLCQKNRAGIPCWKKTGNAPPPLPPPFGGGGPPPPPKPVVAKKSKVTEKYVAKIYCPAPEENFILAGTKGMWATGLVLSPKGIVLTTSDLMDFDFHEKGCLVSIGEPDVSKNRKYQVYQARLTSMPAISDEYKMVFAVPESIHIENNQFLGVKAEDRKFETILDYEAQTNEKCDRDFSLGTKIFGLGYPAPSRTEYEDGLIGEDDLDRKLFQTEAGDIISADVFDKKNFSLPDMDGAMTGSAVFKPESFCFAGLARFKPVTEGTAIQELLTIYQIEEFLEQAIDIFDQENREEALES